ncbi:tRNA (adenosine(37)-N6)-threonylcarbamoyltransferase complex dimerization subunit type 1 TsaB [Motiliproteus sediminis]|uniref:tRNA (adenosine(37)-N6)-threonylcarbamoyltransferase complex dimerization subunit type 1 TsaB n=1 Tax=Motiliproteus sediminis TaxID=1468178 RepID=UPI001AEFAC49|nr:tRNA (adenosine(37)-N6)-threonylcarbamoyltransferase complex dimerization subunit type 1 TsaB [Motiliproteus sediminis]
MSRILALDTSSEACSAALWLDGRCLELYEQAPRQHTKLLLPMVERLLIDASLVLTDLDAIAFGRGPGSFTGLRISAGVAQGLALGANLPLLPISTLAALADARLQEQPGEGVLAAIDARMNEVYWGFYRRAGGSVTLVGAEHVGAAARIAVPDDLDLGQHWLGAGTGWQFAAEMPAAVTGSIHAIDPELQPAAGAMARLAAVAFKRGEAMAPEAAQPLYLRDDVAHKKGGAR